jgi:hypothetical protein
VAVTKLPARSATGIEASKIKQQRAAAEFLYRARGVLPIKRKCSHGPQARTGLNTLAALPQCSSGASRGTWKLLTLARSRVRSGRGIPIPLTDQSSAWPSRRRLTTTGIQGEAWVSVKRPHPRPDRGCARGALYSSWHLYMSDQG